MPGPNRGFPQLSEVKSASLTDTVGRLYDHRAHILDLVSPTPGPVLFGPAVTIDHPCPGHGYSPV